MTYDVGAFASPLPPEFTPPLTLMVAVGHVLIAVGIAVAVGLRQRRRPAGTGPRGESKQRSVTAAAVTASHRDASPEHPQPALEDSSTRTPREELVGRPSNARTSPTPDSWTPPPGASPERWSMREVLDVRPASETTYGLSGAAVAELGRTLEVSRRRRASDARVEKELRNLALANWLVERDVAFEGARVPFVIVGPTGIVLLSATDGRWDVREIVRLARVGRSLGERLSGYEGRVWASICLAFDPMPPRTWYGAAPEEQGLGGWILGANWLLLWLYGLSTAQGADEADIQALDAAAGPHWARRSTARLPVTQRFG